MSDKVTVSFLPDCDIHKRHGMVGVPARYDGKTKDGPWAYMCPPCFQDHGIGLGTGRGQLLVLATDNP